MAEETMPTQGMPAQPPTKAPATGTRPLTWILLAILIALVFGAGGYWLGLKNKATDESAATTPSTSTTTTSTTKKSTDTTATDETASWKTYTNTTIGYSFKYPSNWAVGQSSETALEAAATDRFIEVKDADAKLRMRVVSEKNTGALTLSKFADQVTPMDAATITGKADYKIGSSQGIKESVEFSGTVTGIQKGLWYFTTNNVDFVTFSTPETSTSTETKNILSTFEFTK